MRIADKMQYNQVNRNVSKNRNEMADLQNQAATQKRVTKPSDDPTAATRVLAARTEEKGNRQFIRGIDSAKSFLEFTDQTLGEMTELLVRAKELAVGQANDAGSNEESRRVVGTEIDQIFNQSIQIGNRKLGERFIFGGFRTSDKPFTAEGEYLGDDGSMKVPINKDSFVTLNIPGNRVFLGEGWGQGDEYKGPQKTTPQTTEEIQDFKLNEAERIKGNQEESKDAISTRGPASVNSPKGLSKADPVTQSTGVNVLGVLKDLQISLMTNDKQGIQESLEMMDQAINQVVLSRSETGARVMVLNNLNESLQKAVVDNKTTASQLEDADVFQVMSDINKTDSALKATLETSGKLIQTSLLDFLK